MAEPFAAAEVCDTCGSARLHEWLVRADGIKVLRCPVCATGVVERLPGDLAEIYEGDYYGDASGSGVGYSDYAYTAEHSVGWAAAVVDVLRPEGGRALDVGCADGLLLGKLGEAFGHRAGVEMNRHMAQVCRDRGVQVLAHDIYDPILERHVGSFDVVTAVAVFEHVPRFAAAVRRALELLKPDGVLLFEVPLMSEVHDNDCWLTSSLEHLYYPTTRSLEHLFNEVLEVPLHGGEVHIRGYGSTFVGLLSRDREMSRRLASTWARLAQVAPPGDLDGRERRAWVHLHLLHSAQTTPALVAGFADLPSADVNVAVARRVSELWRADLQARDDDGRASRELRAYLPQVEQARDAAQRAVVEALAETAAVRRDVQAQQSRADEHAQRLERALDQAQRTHQAAVAEALDWERQAHQTHAQLLGVISSSAWRATGPARAVVTSVRRARRRAALLGQQVNRRRVTSALALLRHRDFTTIRQRTTAVHGTAVAAAGLSAAVERGPAVQVLQEPWESDRPLVTVVITCFNYGQFVDDAVRSVLAQTLRRVEVIVVDGGSTDSVTRERLGRLAQELPDVRLLLRDGPHLVGDNRNFGIAQARGRYVCCLDADDALRPIYLEMAAYLLEVHDYDLVSTSTRTFGLRQETFGVLPRPALSDMVVANNVSTVAVFRQSLWTQSGGFHDTGLGVLHVHEDWKLWVRLAALGARMINITGEQLFLYRVHSQHSLSNLAGTPGLQAQRAAVQAFNSDVLQASAYDRSASRREEVHEVQNGFVNLTEEAQPDVITVLLTMPFLIVGGAERLISEITRHLNRHGFRIIIVTTLPVDPEFGDTSDWFADVTTEIYHLPRLLDVDRWERFVDYLVTAKGVQVLWQAGSAFAYALLPTLRARHPQLRVVDLLFNTVGHAGANRSHAGDIDLTIVENAEVERWLLAKGARPEQVLRVESGVDLEVYRPCEDRPQRQGLRVGFSGRFSVEKDPLAFVEIAARVLDPDVAFVMTGAGPLEAKVRARVRGAGLQDRVQVLGVVDDVRAHLASLDVLVLPSSVDGRPVVVLEALALGVPVIASSVGALPELVQEGVSGFLCEPGDHAAFASRITQVARDAVGRAEMGLAARRFAERSLDARSMFASYEDALRSLVGAPAQAASSASPAVATAFPGSRTSARS